MDKLSPAILESFGINSAKKEKGHYLCNTGSGPMKLHITPESPEAIHLQHSIKEYLAKEGFPHTGRYQLTKTGQPYISVGRETYVMTKVPKPHNETDFENETEALKAAQALAHFHIAAQSMPQAIQLSQPLPEIYTRQMKELSQMGKQVRRGSRLSDFDVLFIKHAPQYGEIMQDSINRLAKTNYARLHSKAISQGSLCHNALKEENLLATNSDTYIINFAEAEIDLQLCDLAALIRRYAQRSSKSIPINRLLETYSKIAPLPHEAVDIIYALLIFPWAFMKIITQYYSKKRNWTPNGLINRMDTILAERESYEKYVQELHF